MFEDCLAFLSFEPGSSRAEGRETCVTGGEL